jgi:8-oxo-dGTP pyrophosphatase MutT (NUDIX family)
MRSVSGEATLGGLGGGAVSGSGVDIGRGTGKHGAPTAPTLRARLNDRTRRSLPETDVTAASVLAPLFFDDDGALRVWLLRKIDTLRRHAGQVALPGGKRDPADESSLATALREAHEEIGLPREAVEPLGVFDDYFTTTGYVVSAHVGLVVAPFAPIADPGEVARIFSTELAIFLVEPTPHTVSLYGGPRAMPGYTVEGETVWGATSAILQDLARTLLLPAR